MQLPSSLLENAVAQFAKLPGIGKKTALRLVLHLLKQDAGDVTMFGDTITKMRNEIKFCQRCFNISDSNICSTCSNSARNQQMICVVENIRDVIAIESTGQFNGTYHVLGGIIFEVGRRQIFQLDEAAELTFTRGRGLTKMTRDIFCPLFTVFGKLKLSRQLGGMCGGCQWHIY